MRFIEPSNVSNRYSRLERILAGWTAHGEVQMGDDSCRPPMLYALRLNTLLDDISSFLSGWHVVRSCTILSIWRASFCLMSRQVPRDVQAAGNVRGEMDQSGAVDCLLRASVVTSAVCYLVSGLPHSHRLAFVTGQ